MFLSRNQTRGRGVALTLAVSAVLSLVGLFGADTARAETRKRVALLPVVIHAMEEQAYLRDGLHDMLLARLARDPEIAAIAVKGDTAAAADLEAARAQGREAGAEFVVYGSFTHFGEGASLDLFCAPVADGAEAPRQVFVHAGSLGQIIPTLDGLVDRVARYVTEGAIEVAESGPAAGTPSPASLRALEQRIEAIEQALESGVQAEEQVEVPGIFQVYPDADQVNESAQSGGGVR